MNRTFTIGFLVFALVGAGVVIASTSTAGATQIHVYKSPTCGCCGNWVEHLEENGFDVVVEDVQNVNPIKAESGVPRDLGSCHTALVEGYVIEGHVPADAIERFLAEPPESAIGLAVPGMPVGSPGMEGPNPQPYEIIAFDREGNRGVFERR